MTRYRAALLHFFLSLVTVSAIFGAMLLIWYPPPLLAAVGAGDVLRMLWVADVVLGPMLTLIVFNKEKKSLAFDLSVVAVLQAVALAYGVHTLLSARPVYVAALGPRFDVVQANHVSDRDLAAAGEKLPWFGPKWVGIKEASDPAERERVIFSALAGADYGHMPQYHATLGSMRDRILQNAKPMDELRRRNPGQDAEITTWLADHGVSDSSVRYVGLKARAQDMAVIVDAINAKVVGVAPFRPWG